MPRSARQAGIEKQRFPAAASTSYSASIEGLAASAERALKDIEAGFGAEANLTMLEEELELSAEKLLRPARTAFSRTALHAKKEVSRMLGIKLPAEGIQDLQEVFAQRQVQLIQRAVRDQATLLRAVQHDPKLFNKRSEELSTLRYRLRLISRNEVAKLHEAEVEHWAKLSGSPGGWYISALVERTRATHRVNHKKFFLWEDRPAVMGETNCKCVLVPKKP